MQWELTFSEDAAFLAIRAWGLADVEGIADYIRQAVMDPRWKPGTPCLMDFKELDLATFPMEHLRSLVQRERPFADRIGAAKIAILVTRPVDFGIARMWESFSQDLGQTRQVFYDMDEALAWLGASLTGRRTSDPGAGLPRRSSVR